MLSLRQSSLREMLGWCLFDFANSAFATVILTVVYSYSSGIRGLCPERDRPHRSRPPQ